MGTPSSIKTLRTPTWAMPRANPPPRATPTRGRPTGRTGGMTGESGRDTVSANARKERRNPTSRFKKTSEQAAPRGRPTCVPALYDAESKKRDAAFLGQKGFPAYFGRATEMGIAD